MSIAEITILIPTYHRPALLLRAIDSIVNQSFSNFIIRIHDNGSDSETLTLMSNIISNDSRIKYHRHPENIGALKNFQSLIDEVATPFYSVISDDDFFLPGHLESGIKCLMAFPEAYFYSSATATVNLPLNSIHLRNQTWNEGFYEPSKKITCKVSNEHFTSTGTIFSNRVREKMGCFHSIAADDVLSVLLTGCFPFVASPRIGAIFTVNERKDECDYWSSFTMDQLLKAGALDRKFVLDHSHPDTETCLLEHLENYYGNILERKAGCSYRQGVIHKEMGVDYCKNKFINYLLRSSTVSRHSLIGLIKTYSPNLFLKILVNVNLTVKTFFAKRANNIFPISVSSSGFEYLRNCNLDQKNKFLDHFAQLCASDRNNFD